MKILDLFNLTAEQQAKLTALGDVQVIEPADLNTSNVKSVDAIYGWNQQARTVLGESPKLKFVQSNSAGVDYMPLNDFADKGITLTNVSGIHAEPISEMVIAYVLAFARGIVTTQAARRNQKWLGDQVRMQNYTIKNRTAVIFGTGHMVGQSLKNFRLSVPKRLASADMVTQRRTLTRWLETIKEWSKLPRQIL